MSGFTGLFRRSGVDVTEEDLEGMVETLAHRGPDGRGTWRQGPVGLGHQQLQTTPESQHASLPAVGDDGTHVLTMDARVDNRTELCEALGFDGSHALPDSEFLLAAYDEWGVDCFERVVGAFAVVIYDRARDRLVCARDPTGIKPFHYVLTDELFAFGSEPKAMLSLPDVSAEIDDASVFAFLADEFDDPEATFFESVARLPAGRVLVVEFGTARTRSYWSPWAVDELDLPSDEAYERRFRELFTEAVRSRLRRPSGVDVGSYLSGGLDSTAVACTAQSLLGSDRSLRTFSVTHEGYPDADETEYLHAALDACDFDATVRDAGGVSPFPDLDRRLAHHDASFPPPLFVMDQQFADEFGDENFRVLLSGLGGDQALYYGTGYLTELFLGGNLARFAAELDAQAEQEGTPRRTLLFESLAVPLAPQPVRRAWRLYHGGGSFESAYPALDAEAAAEAGFAETAGYDRLPPTDHREEQRRFVADAKQNFFFEVADTDRALIGVEPRYPYWDRRVVEFCLALPADQKMRGGVGRHLLRRTLRDDLPEPIRTRTDKANFIPSWMDGLHAHEQDRLRERLVRSPRHVTSYLDEAELRAAYERFVTDPSYEDAWLLTKAYAVETWLGSRGDTR